MNIYLLRPQMVRVELGSACHEGYPTVLTGDPSLTPSPLLGAFQTYVIFYDYTIS